LTNSKSGMAYRVSLTARAERDLALLFHEKNAQHSEAALTWYRGLKEAILSLEEHPTRCPVMPENESLRHLALWPQASHLPGDLPNRRKT
jgi:hypothetical protein